MSASDVAAIDGWINVSMGGGAPPEFLVRVKEDYLRGGDEFFRSFEPGDLIPEMDRLGVRHAIVSASVRDENARQLRFVTEAPERFSIGLHVDPRKLVDELWGEVDRIAAELDEKWTADYLN